MPLIRHNTFRNPSNGGGLPNVPLANAAGSLAPAQGDHLFGDIMGAIGTAMQHIFGGGALWQQRLQAYDSVLASLWRELNGVDLGHSATPPIVQRTGAPEPDEHSHMFGGYSARLQWRLCEIVCTGFEAGVESRKIGGATHAWKRAVLADFDNLMDHLVDSDALAFYLVTPTAERRANPANVRHTAISLAAATTYIRDLRGNGNAAATRARANVSQVLGNYAMLRNSLAGLLTRLDGNTKKYHPATQETAATWKTETSGS
ncbi:hypothetical protein F2P45_13490 [Massilia sp. CCM 8733]|uniref:Uncharacterized protein n=1 Tax=Massilia mucilaginosa TaxID=2609282 RepID=A0ABX0NTC3_9BURK|nr:hypothetical protein [Massilia mucilaginosa]NHZ90019.1 hypothetical protein [Massilia mucilaginosa]